MSSSEGCDREYSTTPSPVRSCSNTENTEARLTSPCPPAWGSEYRLKSPCRSINSPPGNFPCMNACNRSQEDSAATHAANLDAGSPSSRLAAEMMAHPLPEGVRAAAAVVAGRPSPTAAG